MRHQYYEQLDRIIDDLVRVTDRVRRSVGEATSALLDTDVPTAERVISAGGDIETAVDEIEERALVLLATQQPVATDLRQLVATLRMVADLQRMSALAVHVAKIARRRAPEAAVPSPVRPLIGDMARVGDAMIASASRIVAGRDLDAAAELELEDDRMDRLRRDLFRVLLDGDWEHGVDTAIDLALLGRYYERIGDHAVSMGRRVVFLVTGEMPVG